MDIVLLVSGTCASQGTLLAGWYFAYDGDGNRVKQVYTDGSSTLTTYYFFGGAYEVQSDGTTETVRKYYAFAGMTIAMDDGSGLKYFLTDHLGSVVVVTDDTGALLSEQRYLPSGQVRTDVGAITQTDFGYTGQRALDAQNNAYSLGLMDYKARFYDPYLNRFTQADTITPGGPQGLNRYSYTSNNPTNRIDPTGHDDGEPCRYDDIVCFLKLHIRPPVRPPVVPGRGGVSSNVIDTIISDSMLDIVSDLSGKWAIHPTVKVPVLLPLELKGGYGTSDLRFSVSMRGNLRDLSKAADVLGFVTQVAPAQIENFTQGFDPVNATLDFALDSTIWGVSSLLGAGASVIGTPIFGIATTVVSSRVLNYYADEYIRPLFPWDPSAYQQPQPPLPFCSVQPTMLNILLFPGIP